MNQQRSRRFRTAKDAEESRRKAIAKGEELPKEAAFDSNCITPGTEFMARLSEQLKYFIAKKISDDASWAGVKVILSGHEVPGEGEHKIMEFIRAYKVSSEYLPNTRHCLYGLDADLMMLGLLSHEPHFALLREEVTFGGRGGKKKTSATSDPDNQNFYLMYLSIFREYLDLEFSSLRDSLSFEYDMERIIDDFILLSFFVGNDFLPHLPGLHINEGALASFFTIYKAVLPKLSGYINTEGHLNLERLEELLKHIAEMEREQFLELRADLNYVDEKRKPRANDFLPTEKKSNFNMPLRDKKFIMALAKELGVSYGIISDPDESESAKEQNLNLWWDSDDDQSDEESNMARMRVIKRYDKVPIVDEDALAVSMAEEAKQKFEAEFSQWKRDYYKEKLEFDPYLHPAKLSEVVFKYVEGLQWVLFYYYRGVPSWGWFYPFHYAPKITDLVDLKRFHPIEFEIGTPFLPFYQLMGVLPAASKSLIPSALRDLMTDPNSPIADFYPLDFELDLNGKKQDWEAVVKIPFIDEHRLVQTLKAREAILTSDEKKRNSFNRAILFEKVSGMNPYIYPSSLPGRFPDIAACLAKLTFVDITSPKNPNCGIMPGSFRGRQLRAGFPSLQTLPHTATLGFHGVNVFNSESSRESVVISISNQHEGKSIDGLALNMIGKRVFVGWPFLQESIICSVIDELFAYSVSENAGRRDLVKTPNGHIAQDRFYNSSERIENLYSKRFGTLLGPIEVIVGVRLFRGMKLKEDGSMEKDFGEVSCNESDFALQTLVVGPHFEDPRYRELPPPLLADEFPIGSNVFFLGNINYGALAEVRGHSPDGLCLRLFDLNVTRSIAQSYEQLDKYLPSFKVSKSIGASALAISKITSSLQVVAKNGDQRTNIGLNLKFDGKGRKVLGYSRKSESGWEYSQKAFELIREYKTLFPEIFLALEKKSRQDFYNEIDFFHRDIAHEKMAAVKEWLKGKGVKDFDRVPLDARALPKEYIGQLEKAVDGLYAEATIPSKLKSTIIKNVPRAASMKPAHVKQRLDGQNFDLGERILYALDSGSVPLAARGTIVGINGKSLDVVFDFPFMGGHTLDGRCSANRGMSVHRDQVINTTRPQPPKSVLSLFNNRVPDRIPGNPLLSTQQREALSTKKPFEPASAPPKNAWSQSSPKIETPEQESSGKRQDTRQDTRQPQNNVNNRRIPQKKREPPVPAPGKQLYDQHRQSVQPGINVNQAQSSDADKDALALSLKSILHIGEGSQPENLSGPEAALMSSMKSTVSTANPTQAVGTSQNDIASQILASLRTDVPNATSRTPYGSAANWRSSLKTPTIQKNANAPNALTDSAITTTPEEDID
ncbi:hypothetical protein HDU97_007642, partial [Phlyctochytrium planicorne]